MSDTPEELSPEDHYSRGLECLDKAEDLAHEQGLPPGFTTQEEQRTRALRVASYAQLAQAHFQGANVRLLLDIAARSAADGGGLDLAVIGDPTHG